MKDLTAVAALAVVATLVVIGIHKAFGAGLGVRVSQWAAGKTGDNSGYWADVQ